MKLRYLLVAMLCTSDAFTCGTVAGGEHVDYLTQIKPVLAERCYACHGALKQEGGLRLDTAAAVAKGGDSGPAITLADADGSLLIQRVTATDETERMPAEGQALKPEQIAALRNWIAAKAPAPADEPPEQDPRDHWAFRQIVRPPVPEVAEPTWVRNPIDAFVAQKHDQHGLKRQPEAPREVLIRRLYLDLIGLPPTEAELRGIDGASDDQWYEPLVEQLLSDPRYGERWARHWMDIWRYSDWWGLNGQVRNSQFHIWHWRDWIVESLNANLSYAEMIRSMLAADELYPNDLDKLRASGFLARNFYVYGRNIWMEETVEHVSKGFLGLTTNCAKCHDHKYDPIKQVDYYRMRAFFEPYHARLDMVPGVPDLNLDGIPRAFDGKPEEPTYLFERGEETRPDKSTVLTPGVPEMLAFKDLEIHPVSLPKDAWQPERRPWVLKSYLATAQSSVAAAEKVVADLGQKLATTTKNLEEIAKTEAATPPPDEKSRQAAEAVVAGAAAELHAAILAAEQARIELLSVKKRAAAMRAAWVKADDAGSHARLAAAETSAAMEAIKAERRAAVAKGLRTVADIEVRLRTAAPDAKAAIEAELTTAREALGKVERAAAAPPAADEHYTPLVGATWSATRHIFATTDDPKVEFPDHSTGRRTALADWIVDPRNPLTARVAVNHIWARHLGAPLVASVFNFGRNGAPPTHPELVDWLAAELINSGWDMKHLHRLIVLSSAYRMTSSVAGGEANQAKDPDNLRLWRRPPLRLESEVVRDSILSLAGTLDLTRGGPPVYPDAQADSKRRSLYFFHSNNDRNLFLTTFDEAAVNECYRRDQSIIPQQALALSNSGLVQDAAQQIAQRLAPTSTSESPQIDDEQFVKRAYYALLCIRANAEEVRACTKMLDAWRKLPDVQGEESADRARQYMVWALLNHNDFVTVR